ncbi:aspartate/glutamate racemase family protein [Alcaligenes nematophilus]|uniref:aspartate/glutamate racemase family protein n=1 Tax=Alcaligenes TaxID=507 RepID=UPI00202F707B|nr:MULTISPECIES: aspartate/glutamate racemase family protein [Alcaligenes]URW81596.1 aspartate/glutamate racemase family protein [Alcaligenes sp. DN25]WEA66412.1 aspartate/glutamate racemase family protein [Alcaligenes faecalis]
MSHTVLLINPNTSRPTTDMMVALAQACFQSLQRRDIQVRGLTAPEGPGMLTEMEELEQAAAISRHPQVLAQAQDVDGIIVGAFGDPGLQALTERLTVPVIGIGQASMMLAARAGTPFGIATTTPGLKQSILDQVQRYGWSEQFSGLRLTPTAPLDLAQAPDRQDQELADSVAACIEQDGARAVIIGGGPLAQSAQALQSRLAVPVINPIIAACELMAERLPPDQP